MYQRHHIGAVLLMGGTGIRFGKKIPKQFCRLQGKPLYRYALETFKDLGVFDEIVLVCHPDWQVDEVGVRVAIGGATRQESSRAGILGFEKSPEIVLIHDAVRPFISKEIILKNLDAAIQWGACDTCIASADTLVHAPDGIWIEKIPKREDFLRGQTPQTFRYDWIVEAHEKTKRKNASDDCSLVLEQGKKVAVIQGSEENFKITSEFDLQIASILCESDRPDSSCSDKTDAKPDPKRWDLAKKSPVNAYCKNDC